MQFWLTLLPSVFNQKKTFFDQASQRELGSESTNQPDSDPTDLRETNNTAISTAAAHQETYEQTHSQMLSLQHTGTAAGGERQGVLGQVHGRLFCRLCQRPDFVLDSHSSNLGWHDLEFAALCTLQLFISLFLSFSPEFSFLIELQHASVLNFSLESKSSSRCIHGYIIYTSAQHAG